MASKTTTTTTRPAPARTVVKPAVAKPAAAATRPAARAPAAAAAKAPAAPKGQTPQANSVNSGVIRADLTLTLVDGSIFRIALPNATLISPALGVKPAATAKAATRPPVEEPADLEPEDDAIEGTEGESADELVDEGVEGIVDESADADLEAGEDLEIEDENEGEELDAELEGGTNGEAEGEAPVASCGIDLTQYGDAQLREWLKQADVKADAAGTPVAKLKTAALRKLVDENCDFTPQE